MSLILEALRKLDREKLAPDRGFLVLAPASWPSRGGSRAGAAVAALLAALLLAAGGVFLWRSQAGAPRVAARPSVAAASSVLPAPVTLRARGVPSAAPAQPPTHAARAQAPAQPLEGSSADPARPDPAAPASTALPAAPEEPPARPAVTSPLRAYHLQAISQRDGRPVAVLNDRMVYEGDGFDGIRIVRIGETEVEIEVEGRRMVIRF